MRLVGRYLRLHEAVSAVGPALINAGPTAEDRFVQAQVAADEAHQGMEDYRLLVSFGPDGEAMAQDLLHRKCGDHLLEAFNMPMESWVDLCMFCCTMDLVAWYHLKAFENSSLAPFARAMCSMVPEERFHASFGANRVRRLVTDPAYLEASGGTRADVETALRKWYPRALDTFGASKSKLSELAVHFGIRRWGNEELRQMYLQDINPLLLSMGLQPPAPEWGSSRRLTPVGHAPGVFWLAVRSQPESRHPSSRVPAPRPAARGAGRASDGVRVRRLG